MRQGVEHRLDAVLRLQPGRDDVELQRADHADDRVPQPGLRDEDLHQAFFLELPHRFVEPFVTHVQPDAVGEVLGGKLRNRRIAAAPPAYSVSPIASRPGLTRPTTSPGTPQDRLAIAAEETVDARQADRRPEPRVRRPPCPSSGARNTRARTPRDRGAGDSCSPAS